MQCESVYNDAGMVYAQESTVKYSCLWIFFGMMDVYASQAYIFLSTSMPPSLIWRYAQCAKKVKGQVCVYGFWAHGKSILDEWCQVSQEYGINVTISPALFKKFSIRKVPAVVVKEGDKSTTYEGPQALQALIALQGNYW